MDKRFPEELLDRIVSLTPCDCLIHLCLTSKTINRIAMPYLYGNIFLKETCHLPALAYLVFTSPTHAALVRSLIVPDTWAKLEEQFIEWSWPRIEDPELHRVLQRKCTEYGSTDEAASEIYEKIKSGKNEDAILALLLASLPRLRRLNINFGIGNDHTDFVALWPTIVNAIRSSSGALPNADDTYASDQLQIARSTALSVPIDIMITGAEDKYPNNPVHLSMFIHLPNLRSIYGWGMGDGEGDWQFDPNPETNEFAKLNPRSCPVEYIELRRVKLHMANFELLLGATIPGKLKTFSYEVGCTWAWCNTEHPRIMKSLEPHQSTLENLGLSHEDYYPYQDGVNSDKPYPCCFTSFTAMKRLKVAPVYIWGHDSLTDGAKMKSPGMKEMLWKALPMNLVELWITRAEAQEWKIEFISECLLPALDLVVQNKGQAFPRLERLRIELPPLGWESECFDSLASICRAASTNGIHATIILYDLFDRWGKFAVERQWGWDEEIEWEPTRYSRNRESAKVWITKTLQLDLAEALKDITSWFVEEGKKMEAAMNERKRQAIDYSTLQFEQARLEQFIEKRLDTKSCYKYRSSRPTVVT